MSSFLQSLKQLHPFLFFLFPLSFVFLLLINWLFTTKTPKKNLPPTPPKLPVLGNLHQLGLFPHHSLRTLSKKHGPLMLLHLGSVPTLIVSSAEAAYEIMKTHDLIFSNRPKSKIAKKLLYDMKDVSVAPYGEYWRQMKSIFVLQLLSSKRVQSFRAVRYEETVLMIKKIKDSSSSLLPVDLSEMFTSFANDVVCRAAFGRKYSEGESGKKFMGLLRDFLILLGGFSMGDFIPWLAWVDFLNGLDAKLDKVAKGLDEFLEGVVEEHLDKGMNIQSDGKEDFVDILLKIHKDDVTGFSIDRDSIKALILDTFSAGTDTTSTVLEWAMTEILRNPIVMKKLQTEIRAILNAKPDVTEDDLEKMHYLKAVIKETLRFHPPIPLLVPREASQDVKVMGYDIAAGTMVITNALAIGRDPCSWNEPEEFQPERFLNSSIDFKGHDFQLIPFGAGRRGCPGISFAMATNEFLLANLLHKFDWELPNGEDLDMTESPGVAIRRRVPLVVFATPCSC